VNKRIAAMAIGLTALFASFDPAQAVLIFASDYLGNVAKYETTTGSLSALGSLNGFTIGKVMGMAYDGTTNSILLIDRNGRNVYSMNVQTGVASSLFSLSRPFQGGAVKGGRLYVIDETYQTMEAFSLSDFGAQGLSGGIAPDHTHAIGVNKSTGQLYSMANHNFRHVSDDGVFGNSFLTTTGSIFNDIDYLAGDFVGVVQGSGITRIDGVTGDVSSLVTRDELLAVGVDTITIAGQGVAVVVPEPSPLTLLSVLFGFLIVTFRKWEAHRLPGTAKK